MITSINFEPGNITCNNFDFDLTLPLDNDNVYLTEDMLQVQYPNQIILDVGWHGQDFGFVIKIVQGHEAEVWHRPLFKRRCRTIKELKKNLEVCVDKIRSLLKEKVLGDIDFSPGVTLWDHFDFDPKLQLEQAKAYLTEDLLQISFNREIYFDVKWIKETNIFVIRIIQGDDLEAWNNPIDYKECRTLDELKNILKECVEKIREILKKQDE